MLTFLFPSLPMQVALLVAAEFWEQGDLEISVLQQQPIVSTMWQTDKSVQTSRLSRDLLQAMLFSEWCIFLKSLCLSKSIGKILCLALHRLRQASVAMNQQGLHCPPGDFLLVPYITEESRVFNKEKNYKHKLCRVQKLFLVNGSVLKQCFLTYFFFLL